MTGYFSEIACSAGASARHGEHQEAHTFITVIFPFSIEVFSPKSDSPLISGAKDRFSFATKVTTPSPATKDSSLTEVPPDPQPEKIKEVRTNAEIENLVFTSA